MKEYTLETKSRYVTVTNGVNPVTGNEVVLVGVFSKVSGRLLATYEVSEHTPFESFSALLKFAKASQLDTPSHPIDDLPSDDSIGGVSPSSSVELHPSNDALTDDSHSPVQSPISLADHIVKGSLAGESSPVAASSYSATSDTPFILKHYPQTCSQCKTSLSDFNTNDLNPICNACLWFSEDVDETDLYEDDRDKTYPLEPPKFKTKSSYLAVLS